MSHFRDFFVSKIGPLRCLYDIGGKMKRNNALKAVISLTLVMVMVFSLMVPAFAAKQEDTTVQPRWTSIHYMEVVMAFADGTGYVTGSANKKSTASHIVGTLYLYKWNGTTYEYMDEVSGWKTVGTLGLEIVFDAEPGVQYKGVLTVVAYTDNIGESETIRYYETYNPS